MIHFLSSETCGCFEHIKNKLISTREQAEAVSVWYKTTNQILISINDTKQNDAIIKYRLCYSVPIIILPQHMVKNYEPHVSWNK